jgi:hypothetical protein
MNLIRIAEAHLPKKRGLQVLSLITIFLLSTSAWSGMLVTGTIHTLHINLKTNRAHIYLDGMPTFDGGSCPGIWTGNSLDDEKFTTYMWPALTNAKNRGFAVTVEVEGCEGGYPKIISVDVVPR